ncbi:MAG: deacetylase of acetyl-CoA synthetase, NAD-dependent [Pseudomonadota bacterium]
MAKYERIVILTGAGISAESGLGTFRDKDGLWTQVNLDEVATPEGYARNPMKVHDFYNRRRRDAQNAKANAAHFALAKLEREYKGNVLIVTQNVDGLHEQAGAKNVIHMHGELAKVFCTACDHHAHWTEDLSTETICPKCNEKSTMRPDIVWFGEVPYHMEQIEDALFQCDLFISIGTSGNVYPAAGFVRGAKYGGAHTVELNLEPSEGSHSFAEHHHGPATTVVPDYVDRLLKTS